MAKNNKPAMAYAKQGTSVAEAKKAVTKSGKWLDDVNMSVAAGSKGNYPKMNPYGVGTMRGYGAATKGRKISGKMG